MQQLATMATRRKPADRGHGETRLALSDALRRAPDGTTVQHLSTELDLHPNTVRFHLSRLVRDGLAHEHQDRPQGPGRPRLVYRAGRPEADGHRLLAEALAEHVVHAVPDARRLAVEAGEAKGRRMVPAVDQPVSTDEASAVLTDLMRDSGFDPAWDADGQRLWLRACPFRPTADNEPEVTCSLHLGLMRGALDALGSTLAVTSLEAAPAPHPCVALVQLPGPGVRPTDAADVVTYPTRKPTRRVPASRP